MFPYCPRVLLAGCVSAATVMVLSGCHPAGLQDEFRNTRFLSEHFSDERLTSNFKLRSHIDLDFVADPRPSALVFSSIETTPGSDGLLCEPTWEDPIIVFAEPLMDVDSIEITMQTMAAGFLEVFWAPANQPFGPERMVRARLRPSQISTKYSINLTDRLQPSDSGYRFRIDPVNSDDPFLLKRIVFGSRRYASEGTADEATSVGKVTIDNDTRLSVIVIPDKPFFHRTKVESHGSLVFSWGRPLHSSVTSRLEVVAQCRELDAVVLFTTEIKPGGVVPWTDRRVDIGPLSGQSCDFSFSVAPDDANADDVFVVIANPRLESTRLFSNGPNVVLISLDTVGAQHLELSPHSQLSARNLARFAAEGAIFENAYSLSSLTPASHGVMLTGRTPLNSDFVWFDGHLPNTLTLAGILRRSGFRTGAFTGGVLVTASLGFDKGFERFVATDSLYRRPRERTDIVRVLSLAQDWIASDTWRPFFAFIHSYEAHGPYLDAGILPSGRPEASQFITQHDYFNLAHMKGQLPVPSSELGEYVRVLNPNDQEVWVGRDSMDLADLRYIERIHEEEIVAIDSAIGNFLEFLDTKGHSRDTLVVITSDHGEAFFEHGLLEHGLLYNENLRVPLIIRFPGRVTPGARVHDYVTSADIVPTILDLLGVTSVPEFDGQSLRPAIGGAALPNRPFYAFVHESGFSFFGSNGQKHILRCCIEQENFGISELFDYRRDPGEECPVSGKVVDAELAKFESAVIQSFPGVHIEFPDLEPEIYYRIDVGGSQNITSKTYFFSSVSAEGGVRTIVEGHRGNSTPQPSVRFDKDARMVLLHHGSPVSLELTVSESFTNKGWTWRIYLDEIEADPAHLLDLRGEKEVTVWRVGHTGVPTGSGLSDEEKARLKQLGYIR